MTPATKTSSSFPVAKELHGKPLSQCVRDAVDGYLGKLKDHDVNDLYDMVLHEIEKPLLEAVLHTVRGNQSKAAQMLGMSRSTLRKKLQLHAID